MNLDIYTTEMKKSIWDKAFFMDKIMGTKTLVDFGCADGAMIRMLAEMFPEMNFIGYDINKDLIEIAKAKATTDNVSFYNGDQLAQLLRDVRDNCDPDELCLNFSSVLHEVFSSTGGLNVIRGMIDNWNPKYITVRDMYFNVDSYLELDHETFIKVWENTDHEKYKEFEQKFGDIRGWKNVIHFLMKYQWKDNGWDDELKEDYFSLNLSDFQSFINLFVHDEDKYRTTFKAYYQLPYLTQLWKNLFFHPEIHTHTQQIFVRTKA